MIVLPFPLVARAATLEVAPDPIPDAQFGTVAEAVAAASDGDVVRILGGSYQERITIGKDLAIVGEGDVVLTSLGPEGFFRVDGADVSLRSLSFVGQGPDGLPTRALVLEGGSLDVQRCSFEGHRVDSPEVGGAIRAAEGQLTVRHSTFASNTAHHGAHVWLGGAVDATIEYSTLSLGSATFGGAVAVAEDATLALRFSTLDGNQALTRGGGLYVSSGREQIVEDSIFSANLSRNDTSDSSDGGGVFFDAAASATTSFVRRTVLCGNRASRYGGGGYFWDRPLQMSHVLWVDNAAETAGGRGGGLWIDDATITLTNGTFLANAAPSGQAVGTSGYLGSSWSVFAHHEDDASSLLHLEGGDLVLDHPTLWDNGTFVSGGIPSIDSPSEDDPMIALPTGCDVAALVPDASSPLLGGGPGGTDIGAVVDDDHDGSWLLVDDCDDEDPEVHPGAVEIPADGLDSDCDGFELCYGDADGDGFGGDGPLVTSADLDCDDFGELAVPLDDCDAAPGPFSGCPCEPGAPDTDGDQICDELDPCPLSADPTDTDGDQICDASDVCPGGDDRLDIDADGTPDACDRCPLDPSPSCGREGGSSSDGSPDKLGCGCTTHPGPLGPTPWALALLAYATKRRASHRSGRAHASR